MNFWCGKLLNEVKFGHVLIIGGIAKPYPIKITVDFTQNENDQYQLSDNVILHLSVRFNEKQIVRSSHFPNIGWSDEQISANLIGKTLKNPIKCGKPFTIRLTVLQAIFQVHINDELYCTYDQRCLNDIHYITVKYDFDRITHFDHRTLFPTSFPKQLDNNDTKPYIFNSDVPVPIPTGASFVISGIAAGNPNGEFTIDLYNNNSEQIVMHFNPKFETKMILRTAHRNDNEFYSEDEERYGNFPFKRGQLFKIGIQIAQDTFHYYINGNYFTYMNKRNTCSELAILKCSIKNGLELVITGLKYYEPGVNLCKLTELT